MFNLTRRSGATSICRLIDSRLSITAHFLLRSPAISRSLFTSTSVLQYRDDFGSRGSPSRGGGRGRGGSRGRGGRDERPRTRSSYFKDSEEGDAVDTLLEGTGEYLPKYSKFQELADEGLVHPAIIRQITEGMGHETMTDVQAMTINETLGGSDAIAQARTGTGKTLGFLIPVVNNILKTNPELAERTRGQDRARPSDIRAIILSPARELAVQIAEETRKLTAGTGLVTQIAVGGMGKREMLSAVQREGCHILVATPGRLTDLLTDPYSRISAPKLTSLVLDEADRLLDSGFQDNIREIVKLLPPREEVDRQTLLFSATVPKDVMSLVRETLKPDFHFVQAVKAGEAATHEKIPQKLVECRGIENVMPALLELCKREIAKSAQSSNVEEQVRPFKAIVYFNSTAMVQLAGQTFKRLKSGSSLFGSHLLAPAMISDMNGQLEQRQRTRISDNFRSATSAIMFSTDVTARGMDFPGVTHVIQCGLPPNREQYVHRLGRTGRGDKTGEGWLIIPEVEKPSVRRKLQGMPLVPDITIEAARVDMTQDAQLSSELAATLVQAAEASKTIDRNAKIAGWMATLGNFATLANKQAVVDAMNQWSRYGWGWEEAPSVSQSLAMKLGFSRTTGLNHGPRESYGGDDYGSRGGFSRDGGGRSGGFGGRDRNTHSGGYGGRDGEQRSGGFGGFGASRGRDGDRHSGGFGGRDGEQRSGGFGSSRGRDGDRRSGGFGGRDSEQRSGGFGASRGRDGGRDGDRPTGGFRRGSRFN